MVLYTDGGCSNPNQKDQSIREMISVVANEEGEILCDVSNHGGSNNIAEFIAVEHALQYALDFGIRELRIITDSKTIESWFNRDVSKLKPQQIEKQKRKFNDYEWYNAIKTRVDELKEHVDATIEWQPRENNLAGYYIEETYGL